MIQRLLNRLSLSRILSILVLSLLLPSTAWGQTFSTGKFQVTGDQSPYTYKWLIGTDDSYYWETTLNNATCTGLDDNSQSVQIGETAGSFNAPLTFNNPDNETATSVSFTLNESRLKSITSITINLGSVSEGVSISAGGESFTSLITGTNTLSFSHPRLWDNGFYINISLPQSSSVKISSISITTGTYLGVTVDGIAVTSGVNEGDVLGDGKVSFTSVDGGTPATLTLNNVTLGAIISNLANEQLTIDLAGTNILNGFLSDESSSGTLKFTGSGSLEISNSDGTITGYTAVDFGSFNLKSNSPGINYGEISGTQGLYRLQDYNNDAVGNVTITKETVYPIWVYDDAGDYNRHFLQLTEENKGNVLGDDYSSVSYNSSNDSGTLTVKGAQISHMDYPSFVIGKDIAALTVHLVGYNEIGGSGNKAFLFLGDNTTLTFTTSETQSGYLQTYGTISQGHSGNISYKNGLELDTNSKVITVPESSNKQSTYITGNVSVINEQDGAFYLYTNSTAYYATNTSLKSRDNHAPTYVKVSSSTDGTTKSAGIWPSLTTEQTVQINKVTLQFDWGDCINKNVTVQVRGINEEGEPGNTTWTADGRIYSEAISLTNADGIVEIPLTTEVSSNYIQLYFTSSEGDFSIVPLSVGLTNAGPYDLVVNNIPVTITNRDNVLGDDFATVKFTPATETTSAKLTLNGASISKITSGLEALTIEIKGESLVGYINTNTATTGDKTITITKGSDNSSLALEADEGHSVIEGFKSVSVGDGIYVQSDDPYVYNTSNKQYETTNAAVLVFLTFTTTTYYPLWVTRMQSSDPIVFQVNDENKDNILNIDNASVKFNGTNTLTLLDDEELYKYSCIYVTTGLDALTIAINGSCKMSTFNKNDDTPAITSVNPNAQLTIALAQGATSGDLALISNTGKAISGFKSLTHTELLNLTDGASYSTENLQWSASTAAFANEIKKPTIEINYNSKYFSIKNPNAGGYGGTLMRKTVRMTSEGKVEDDEESISESHSQDYNNNVAIWKYWVKANNQVSDTIYACRLGLEDVEATYGDTSIPTPNILPENINGVSLTYSTEGYDADVAEAVNGAITIKKTGRQPIDAAFSNIPADYTFLTDEESGTPEASFSLMVKPQKPTLSLEAGTYVGTQTVEVGNISPNATAKYYTYEGTTAPDNPTVSVVPENNKIEIESSKTLVVYSETEYDLGDNTGTGYLKSETESATYTINIDISDFIVLNKEGTAAFEATATYTGSAIVPEFKVVNEEGSPLRADTDYSVSYKKVGEGAALTDVTSMVDVGSYKIVITGTGNYGGSISKDFEITKGDADLMFYYIVDGEKNYPEVGNAVYGSSFDAPLLENPHNLLVTYSSKVSAEEGADDSDIATIDATTGTITIHKAGTAIIIAATQGNDNYSAGTALYELNVAKADLNIVTIAEIEDKTYTGSAIKPAVTVTLNGETVSADDYDIAYTNNINVSKGTDKAKITLTAKSTSTRFAENTTKEITFSIIAKSLAEATITLSDTEYTYDGNTKNPSVSITFESEGADGTSGTTTLTEGTDYDVTYKKVVGESEEGIAANEIISAATYKAIATAKGNYTGSKEATFAIAKANITPTITLEGWTYGDNANNPSVSGNTGNGSVTHEYKLQNEDDSKYGTELPTEAGDYTIKTTIAATANYEAAVDSTHFTIAKANITPRVTLEGWTYGDAANTPSVSGNTGNGSVTYEYKLQNEDDSKYGTELPTEAGDYTIKTTIAATANYEAAVDSTHFTIAKANITPRVTLEGWTYGDAANDPSVSGNTGNGSVTYEYKLQNEDDSKYGTELPTEAGNYTIKATIAATANYEAAVDSTHFTIAKANITPKVTLEGWTYGDNANNPSISGNTGNGSITYEYKLQNEEDSKYGTEVPAEAGDYTIKATIAATANYEAAVDSTHFTISKANITPKVTLEGWTYGDNANNPSVSGNTGNGSVTYEYKLQNEADSKYKADVPTEAGDYTIKATIAATANYAAAEDSTHFTIAKAYITPRVTLEGWTYGDAANDPSVSGNTGNGNVTYEYKLQNEADSKYKANVPTEAGDYTIKATIAATANYEAAVDSTHFAITKANITPRVAINGWAYGATANTPTVSGNTGNGSVTYEYKLQNEADSKYKADVPTEAGDYTIKATIAATANYESAVDSTHFTISKATPSITFDEESYSATYGEAFTAPTPTTSPEGLTVVVTNSSNTQVATITNGVISIIGVGETTITVSFAGNDNYNATTATYKLTVGAASMEIVGTGYSGIYDGQAHGITVTAPEGATIKYGTTEGTYNLNASPEYTDAGSYTVYYQVTQENYQTVTDSKTVVIAKADVSITYNENGYTATYGEEFNPPTPSTNPEELSLTATSSSDTQVATVTDGRINIIGVGETNITVRFDGNNNYNDTTVTYKLTVGAASMEIVGTGYSGIYDGQAHGITVTAPEGATIKYGTTEGTYNLNASPEYTDAGSYTVYYQVTQENYQTVTDSKTVVIAKADVSITYNEDGYTATYGEEFNPPTPSTNPEELPLTATSSSNTEVATVTEGTINIIGVGETNITVRFDGNNNYNDTTVTYKLTVEAASMSVTAEGFSGVYDSEAHGIIVTAPEAATIKYGTAEGTYNLDASPEYTDAGNYTVYYQVTQENYQTVTGSKTVIISKADINPTIALEGWTYGAPANTPEVNGNTGNGSETITYKAEGAEEFSSEVPSEVGTYIVKVTIAETTNYNGGEATSTFTITNRTIDPAEDIEFSEGQSYASFYSADEDLALPEEGIAVFMITGIDGNTLTTQAVTYIPKGVPVLVMKTSGATQAIDPSEVSNNMLHYATSDVTADGTTYILYNGEYVRATGTIPAGKCYLKLNKPSGARALAIGNGTTGIDRLDNTIWATDNWFDLNGRRIEKPTKKGLYIKNGKKVVVK